MKEIQFDFSEQSQKELIAVLNSMKEKDVLKIVTPNNGFETVQRLNNTLIMKTTEMTLKFHEIKIMNSIFEQVKY